MDQNNRTQEQDETAKRTLDALTRLLSPREWEYHTVLDPSPADFKATGEAGWELVSVASEGLHDQTKPRAYFKRPVLPAEAVESGESPRERRLRGSRV
jgi:hypothetical protein